MPLVDTRTVRESGAVRLDAATGAVASSLFGLRTEAPESYQEMIASVPSVSTATSSFQILPINFIVLYIEIYPKSRLQFR